MLILELEEIKKLISIKELFEPIKQSFIDYSSDKVIASPISLLHFDNSADAHIKIAAIKGYDYFTIKVATMFPQNNTQNLPVNDGAIFIFDAKTGSCIATLKDKGYLTDLRTAVAGAMITNEIAKKNSNTVSLIGTGSQAYYQIVALQELRAIEMLTVFGRNISNAEMLKMKIENAIPNLKIKIAGGIEEAVKASEIIITTTSATTPIIKSDWLNTSHHITAIGADDTLKKELDKKCFEGAKSIYVDSVELNKKYGELKEVFEQSPSTLEKTTEFGYFFSTNQKLKSGLTIAKLVGLGVQDLATATIVINNYFSKP
jgi:ornithine cyclodeaminase